MAPRQVPHVYVAFAVVVSLAVLGLLTVHSLIQDSRQLSVHPVVRPPCLGAGDAAALGPGSPLPAELLEVWRPSRTAVVMPFIRCQVENRIRQNLEMWRKTPPCDVSREEEQPSALGELTLVFYYNRDALGEAGRLQSGKTLMEGLYDLWNGLGALQKCFRGGMRVLSANLSDVQDQYPIGPCVQFYNAFSFLEDLGFDHWFQMEPDVTPIQAGWGSELLRYTASNPRCKYWWQSGSNPLYKNEVDFSEKIDGTLDLHLNGNALYCLKSQGYDEFRHRVQRFYPPGGCRVPPTHMMDGYDHAMYRFRLSPTNREYMNGKFSRFRIVDLILNYGVEGYDPKEVLAAHPAAYFVHSRVPYGVKGEMIRRKEELASLTQSAHSAFYTELGRVPEDDEAAPYFRAVLEHRLSSIDLISCVIRQQLRLVESGIEGLTFNVPQMANEADERCRQDLLTPVFGTKELAVIHTLFSLTNHRPPSLKEFAQYNVPGLPRGEGEAEIALRRGELTMPHFAERLCSLNRYVIGKVTGLQSICLNVYLLTGSFRGSCGSDVKYDASRDTLSGTCNNAEGGTTFSECRQTGFTCMTPPGNGDGKLFCDRPAGFLDAPSEELVGKLSGAQAGFAREYLAVFRATDLSGRQLAAAKPRPKVAPAGRYRVWCSDFHAAPIGCSIPLFEDMGISVDARIDYGNCKHHRTKLGDDLCAGDGTKPLEVLRFDNWRGFGLDPCPSLLKESFFETYADSLDLNSIDFFICSHPVANCELYMPFGRPIIIYATTRLEFGRHDKYVDWRGPELNEESPKRFREWVDNIRRLAKDPRHVIAANNMYDAAYIEYFTGIKALYIPSWCGGDASSEGLFGPYVYRPKRMRVLVLPYRTNLEYYPEDTPRSGWPNQKMRNTKSAFGHPIMRDLERFMAGGSAPKGLAFVSLKWEYGSEFSSPAVFKDHPAVVFLPYQFSTMSFFETYRQSVPILVPSRDLLLQWVKEYGLMWERVYGDPARPPDLPESKRPNPNAFDKATVSAWLDTHDFYQGERFPHLLHFSSWQHAVELLQTTDLAQVGLQMHLHNQAEYSRQREEWTKALAEARAWANRARPASHRLGMLDRGHVSPPNFTSALEKYGLPKPSVDTKKGCDIKREEWHRTRLNPKKYGLHKCSV